MPEREIKTTLELDGAEKFNRNLQSVDSELKVLAKELGTLTSQYNENSKTAESLAAQQKNLKDQVALNESKVKGLKDAVDSQTKKYQEQKAKLEELIREQGAESDEVIKQAKELRTTEIQLDSYRKKLADSEQALMKSSAALKKFNDENGSTKIGQQFTAGKAAIEEFKEKVSSVTAKIAPLTNAVKDVGKEAAKITFKAGELSAKAFASTVEKGMKASLSAVTSYTKALTASTAAIAGATVAGATALAKSVISSSSELAEYGGNIDKMSQKMGMSAEAYQEWDAIMQHNGLSIDSMKSSMKTLATAAETGNAAFDRLGITQEQIASMSQEELFSATISALQKVDSETERTYLAGQVLGKGATELGALLNSSAEETESLRKKIHELGGVMSDDAVKSSAKFADNLQDMKASISGLKRSTAAEFLPGLNSMMEGITKVFSGDNGGLALFDEGIDKIVDSFDVISERFADMAEKAAPIADAAIKGVGKVIEKAFPIIINKVPPMLAKILPALTKTIGSLVSQAAAYVNKSLPKFTQTVLPQAVAQIQKILPKLLTNLTSGFNKLLLNLADAIITVMPVVTQTIIPSMIQATTDLVAALINKLPEFLSELTSGAVTLFTGLIDGLNQVMDGLLPILPQMVSDVVEMLFASIPELFAGALELFGKLLEALDQVIQEIMPQLPQFIADMCTTLSAHIGNIIDTGFKLLISLIDGFTKAMPKIMEELPKIVVKIAKKITEPDNLGKLLQSGTDLIRAMANGFPGAIKYIAENIPVIVNNIVESLMSVDWLGLGIDIVKGILEGFLNVGDIIWDYVSSFKDDLMDSITDIFDIFSPSHLMRDEVGKYLGLGVIDGFIGTMEKGTEDMANSIPKEYDTDVKLNTAANFGIDSIKGIHEGFLSVGDFILDYVSNIKENLIEDIKDIFDIFSTSHLMGDETGKYLGLGVVEGFIGTIDKRTKEMADSIPKEFDTDVKLNTAADLSYLRGIKGQAARDVIYNIPVNVTFTGKIDSSMDFRRIAEGIAQETQYQLAGLGLTS